MKENERNLPFLMVKPYSGQYLELLLEAISNKTLQIRNIYETDRWDEIARQIYQKNIDRMGYGFKVGLEGHIRLVNSLFGNRALVLLLDTNADKKSDAAEILFLTQQVKRELRDQTPGGERLEDIVVLMNLEQLYIGCEIDGVCPTGVIGVKDEEGNFQEISKKSGTWDFYYFKYVHTPDNILELDEELSILSRMRILDSENEISYQDLLIMAKLKTLIPPKLFR